MHNLEIYKPGADKEQVLAILELMKIIHQSQFRDDLLRARCSSTHAPIPDCHVTAATWTGKGGRLQLRSLHTMPKATKVLFRQVPWQ